MYEPARRNAAYTAVVGLVLLIYGWMSSPIYASERGSFYNATLDVFSWVLRIGGATFVLIAVLAFVGLRLALLLDALVSMVCGIIMVFCGAYWVKETGLDLSRILFIIFGVMFLKAAWSSVLLFTGGEATLTVAPGSTGWPGGALSDEPTHPASLHPESLPAEGEPPPAEGYLAALSKDKSEPPDAAFK